MRKFNQTTSTKSGPISLLDFPCRSALISCLCDFALKFVGNSMLQTLGNLMPFAHRCNFQHLPTGFHVSYMLGFMGERAYLLEEFLFCLFDC